MDDSKTKSDSSPDYSLITSKNKILLDNTVRNRSQLINSAPSSLRLHQRAKSEIPFPTNLYQNNQKAGSGFFRYMNYFILVM